MAGFNRIQKEKCGTGLIYIRFRKTTNQEQMVDYALKNGLRFVGLPKEYDAGIFAETVTEGLDLPGVCRKLTKDYDNVFLAREHRE